MAKPKNLCVINILFHDAGGREEWDETTAIIVDEKDFDRINKDVEGRVENGMISDVNDFEEYLNELDRKGVYYSEIVKFYLHDVVI